MAQEGWQLEPENSPCPPSSSPPEAPSLCSNNCGFFGSPATMNLCSACYRELVLLKAQVPASSSPSPSPSPSSSSSCSAADVSSSSSCSSASSPLPLSSSALLADVAPLSLPSSSSSSSASVSEASASLSSNPNPSKQVNRCLMCRKRVGLTGFKCRCGDLFCALHRYSDKHNCTFDYKAAARQAISKANPVVKAAKVDKI